MPSYYDSFGLAVLEAMACGVVPIVSPYSGASELIEDGVNGFVVRSADDIERIMVSAQEASLDLERLRSNAINTAINHSWEIVARKLIDMLNEI